MKICPKCKKVFGSMLINYCGECGTELKDTEMWKKENPKEFDKLKKEQLKEQKT